jgi:hypothetical protein
VASRWRVSQTRCRDERSIRPCHAPATQTVEQAGHIARLRKP